MIKKLAVLILALGINVQVYGSEIDLSVRFSNQPPVVSLSLAFNQHLNNIEFLRAFPSLTYLSLRGCQNLGDNYQPISQLTALQTLDMAYIKLTTTIYLEPLVNLTLLDILIFNNTETCLQSLARLPMLKDLKLWCYPEGLGELSRLTSLTKLNLDQVFQNHESKGGYLCPTLDCLSNMTNLRRLNLSSNTYIFYVKPIVKLSNLRSLYLNGCKSIRDLRKLSKLKSLVRLRLNYIDDFYVPTFLEDLKALRKLKNLRSLTLDSRVNTKGIHFGDKIKIHKR